MENNNLEKRIREIMSQHQVPVPDELWQKIDSALPPVKLVWYRRLAYVAVAAVAVIAVIVSVFLYLSPSHNAPDVPMCATDVECVACQTTVECDTDMVVTNPITHVENDAPLNDCDNILCSERDESKETKRVADDYVIEGCDKAHICKYWNSEVCGDACSVVADSNVLAVVSDSVSSEHAEQDVTPQSNICAVVDEEEPYSAPLLSSVEPVDVDESVGDYDIPLRPVRDNNNMRVSLSASTSGSRMTTIPFTFRGQDAEVSYDHHMPLNVKALFEKRFGKWSVGGGLSYAYLTANYEITGNIRNGRQDMHYVGIPIYVAYEFARIKRFSFYASVGGQIDFNTAGKHIESDDSYFYKCIGTYEFRDEKPQLSAQAHVGVAFDLLDQLALYVEPTLGYYFDNNSWVHTVWRDNPLSFYLTVGIRTSF